MCQSVYPLAAYGDVTTLAGAQKAWEAAVTAAGQCGGGLIELSTGTHAAFKVRQSHPGITVVDARGGTLRIQAPVLDYTAIPDGYAEGGVSIVRTRQEPAPLVGEFSAQSVLHRNLHGGSSVETTLLEEVTGQPGGPPVRWYPAGVNGTFVGKRGEGQYPRGKAAYRTGILLNAVTNVGIHLARDIRPDPHGVVFLGAETDAGLAIAIEQATGNRKVIAWSTHPAQEDGPKAYATLGFDPDTTTFFLRAGPGAAQNRSRVSVNGAALADVRGISAPGPTAQPFQAL